MKKAVLILLLFTSCLFAQEGKLIGKIKSVREQLIYLQKSKIESYEDYKVPYFESKILDSLFNDQWYLNKRNDYTYWSYGSMNPFGAGCKNTLKKFNRNGLITEETLLRKDNTLYQKNKYKYDNDSHLTISTITFKGPDSSIVENFNYNNNKLITQFKRGAHAKGELYCQGFTSYTYNKSGELLTTEKFYEWGYDGGGDQYTYTENPKVIEQETWQLLTYRMKDDKTYEVIDSPRDNFVLSKRKIYNEKNQLIEKQEYRLFTNEKDSIISQETFEEKNLYGPGIHANFISQQFDTKILAVQLDVCKKTTYDYENNSALITFYKYDFDTNENKMNGTITVIKNNNDQETLRRVTPKSGKERFYTTEYDSQNRISKYRIDTGYPEGMEEYEYFYKDNLVSKIIISKWKDKTIFDFSYKFDAKGNWIEQIKSVNGKPSFIWKRTIEYYE